MTTSTLARLPATGAPDLLFLLLSPPEATATHLSMLAAVSRRIRDKPVAVAIRNAGDARALRAALLGAP